MLIAHWTLIPSICIYIYFRNHWIDWNKIENHYKQQQLCTHYHCVLWYSIHGAIALWKTGLRSSYSASKKSKRHLLYVVTTLDYWATNPNTVVLPKKIPVAIQSDTLLHCYVWSVGWKSACCLCKCWRCICCCLSRCLLCSDSLVLCGGWLSCSACSARAPSSTSWDVWLWCIWLSWLRFLLASSLPANTYIRQQLSINLAMPWWVQKTLLGHEHRRKWRKAAQKSCCRWHSSVGLYIRSKSHSLYGGLHQCLAKQAHKARPAVMHSPILYCLLFYFFNRNSVDLLPADRMRTLIFEQRCYLCRPHIDYPTCCMSHTSCQTYEPSCDL